MTEKRFRIPADQIRPIFSGRGRCLASDRITVDGSRVAWMYREAPDEPGETGWVFTAGDESAEYTNDSANWGYYDLNTLANYDPEIIPFLEQPVGIELERDARGKFVRSPACELALSSVRALPDAEGEFDLSNHWSATLPETFRRRLERGLLVLGRPGLTIWLQAWDTHVRDVDELRASLRERISGAAFDVETTEANANWCTTYRIVEPSPDERRPSLQALLQRGERVLHVATAFDVEADVEVVRTFVRSIRPRWRS